jgi:hypothetical protein
MRSFADPEVAKAQPQNSPRFISLTATMPSEQTTAMRKRGVRKTNKVVVG